MCHQKNAQPDSVHRYVMRAPSASTCHHTGYRTHDTAVEGIILNAGRKKENLPGEADSRPRFSGILDPGVPWQSPPKACQFPSASRQCLVVHPTQVQQPTDGRSDRGQQQSSSHASSSTQPSGVQRGRRLTGSDPPLHPSPAGRPAAGSCGGPPDWSSGQPPVQSRQGRDSHQLESQRTGKGFAANKCV